MNDLHKAIKSLSEISQAERDAMRAQADSEAAAVRAAAKAEKDAVMKAAGRAPRSKDDMYKDVAKFAYDAEKQSKADGYATWDEYKVASQKNLDAIKAAGIDMDQVYAAANKMAGTEKGSMKLASLGINDDDDLISYVMAKAGIADQTPDKYTHGSGMMHPEVEKYYNKLKMKDADKQAAIDARTEDMDFRAQLDQLKNIAEQELDERVTYRTLAKLSGIENPDKIYPGQKITLPGGGSYTVKKGDTLSHIAQDYRLGNIGKKDDFKGLDEPSIGKKPKGPDPLKIMNPSDEVKAKAAERPKKGGADPLGIFSPKNKVEPKDTPRDGGNPGGTTKAVDQTANIKSKYDAIASTAGQAAADVYAKNVRLDPRATQDTKDALPKYNKVDTPKKPQVKTWGEPGHGFTVPSGTSTTTKGNTVGMTVPSKQQQAQSLYQKIKGMIDAKPSTSGQMKRVNTGDKK